MQRLELPAPGLQRQRPPKPSETSSRLGSARRGLLQTGHELPGCTDRTPEEQVRWDHGTIIADGRQSFHTRTHARTHARCPEECSLKSYFWCPGSSHQLRASGCKGLRRSLSSKFPGCPPHPTHPGALQRGPPPRLLWERGGRGGTPQWGAPVPVACQADHRGGGHAPLRATWRTRKELRSQGRCRAVPLPTDTGAWNGTRAEGRWKGHATQLGAPPQALGPPGNMLGKSGKMAPHTG